MVGGRPRKTQEELDAEMEDYWSKQKSGEATTIMTAVQAKPTGVALDSAGLDDDIDMIE